MTITILNLNIVSLENIKCFFSAELDSGNGMRTTLYGLKIVNGKKEPFVGTPQRKDEDSGKYYSHYHLSPALSQELLSKAQAKYQAQESATSGSEE